jgi:hypothetical protein
MQRSFGILRLTRPMERVSTMVRRMAIFDYLPLTSFLGCQGTFEPSSRVDRLHLLSAFVDFLVQQSFGQLG